MTLRLPNSFPLSVPLSLTSSGMCRPPSQPLARLAALCATTLLLTLAGCAGRPAAPVAVVATPPPAMAATPRPRPKIALALGGGAARGFAHVGVIKILEQNGIVPDMVVGTSAGSLVGALYAGGVDAFGLQRLALAMDQGVLSDWSVSGLSRGLLKGEALEGYVNEQLKGRPLDKLARLFAVVATDLATGEAVVFRSGNAGIAVHASSAVPGAFKPVRIGGRDYVDGGLTHPVPVRAARAMGADIVIAVDVSQNPRNGRADDLGAILLQTFAIMGRSIARGELAEADIVIRPQANSAGTDFAARHEVILEGERAALAALPAIRERIAAASMPVPERLTQAASLPR
jgi:NTE family protein